MKTKKSKTLPLSDEDVDEVFLIDNNITRRYEMELDISLKLKTNILKVLGIILFEVDWESNQMDEVRALKMLMKALKNREVFTPNLLPLLDLVKKNRKMQWKVMFDYLGEILPIVYRCSTILISQKIERVSQWDEKFQRKFSLEYGLDDWGSRFGEALEIDEYFDELMAELKVASSKRLHVRKKLVGLMLESYPYDTDSFGFNDQMNNVIKELISEDSSLIMKPLKKEDSVLDFLISTTMVTQVLVDYGDGGLGLIIDRLLVLNQDNSNAVDQDHRVQAIRQFIEKALFNHNFFFTNSLPEDLQVAYKTFVSVIKTRPGIIKYIFKRLYFKILLYDNPIEALLTFLETVPIVLVQPTTHKFLPQITKSLSLNLKYQLLYNNDNYDRPISYSILNLFDFYSHIPDETFAATVVKLKTQLKKHHMNNKQVLLFGENPRALLVKVLTQILSENKQESTLRQTLIDFLRYVKEDGTVSNDRLERLRKKRKSWRKSYEGRILDDYVGDSSEDTMLEQKVKRDYEGKPLMIDNDGESNWDGPNWPPQHQVVKKKLKPVGKKRQKQRSKWGEPGRPSEPYEMLIFPLVNPLDPNPKKEDHFIGRNKKKSHEKIPSSIEEEMEGLFYDILKGKSWGGDRSEEENEEFPRFVQKKRMKNMFPEWRKTFEEDFDLNDWPPFRSGHHTLRSNSKKRYYNEDDSSEGRRERQRMKEYYANMKRSKDAKQLSQYEIEDWPPFRKDEPEDLEQPNQILNGVQQLLATVWESGKKNKPVRSKVKNHELPPFYNKGSSEEDVPKKQKFPKPSFKGPFSHEYDDADAPKLRGGIYTYPKAPFKGPGHHFPDREDEDYEDQPTVRDRKYKYSFPVRSFKHRSSYEDYADELFRAKPIRVSSKSKLRTERPKYSDRHEPVFVQPVLDFTQESYRPFAKGVGKKARNVPDNLKPFHYIDIEDIDGLWDYLLSNKPNVLKQISRKLPVFQSKPHVLDSSAELQQQPMSNLFQVLLAVVNTLRDAPLETSKDTLMKPYKSRIHVKEPPRQLYGGASSEEEFERTETRKYQNIRKPYQFFQKLATDLGYLRRNIPQGAEADSKTPNGFRKSESSLASLGAAERRAESSQNASNFTPRPVSFLESFKSRNAFLNATSSEDGLNVDASLSVENVSPQEGNASETSREDKQKKS